MRCSLIIPVYNAERTMALCLRAALDQSLPREEYEVIVVDDASSDGTASIAADYPVRVIKNAKQGPAAARNKGAHAAKGDILVFTDSDCLPDFKFLEEITSPIARNADVIGVQGSYRTRQAGFIPAFAQVEIETRYERMSKGKYIDFIGTYAAAYRRDVFLRYGGFDAGFPMASGEDAELSYRLDRKGCRLVFRKAAFVYHRHPATLRDYLKSKFYRGYWRVRLYARHPQKMIRDSYTTQSLKLQVMLMPVFLVCAGFSLFNMFFAAPALLIAASFLFFSIPFWRRFGRKGYKKGIPLIPFILFLRAFSLALGILFGAVNELICAKTRQKGINNTVEL